MTDTLFQTPVHCARCGRLEDAGTCTWCTHSPDPRGHALAAIVRDPEWTHRADAWLEDLYPGVIVSADDLVDEVGLPQGSTNQVGARFSAWAKAGRLRPEGVTNARRTGSHSRLLRTWRVIA